MWKVNWSTSHDRGTKKKSESRQESAGALSTELGELKEKNIPQLNSLIKKKMTFIYPRPGLIAPTLVETGI